VKVVVVSSSGVGLGGNYKSKKVSLRELVVVGNLIVLLTIA
jgi:hypothetical protein